MSLLLPCRRAFALRTTNATRCGVALLLALSSTAATCGDNAPGITAAEYLAARAAASCERLVRCGLFTDAAACAAYFPTDDNSDLLGGVADGSVIFSAVDAPYCLDSIAAVSCDTTQLDARAPLSCPRAFTGTLPTGTTCVLDDQCTSGTCAKQTCDAGTCCTGTCAPPVVAGTPCTNDVGCSPALVCNLDGTCGEPDTIGRPCRRDAHCEAGTGCAAVTLDPGVCRVLPRLGEACPYQRCADLGARCDGHICVESGQNAACRSDAECSLYGLCDLVSGTCGRLPMRGEPCATVCDGDAYCDFTLVSPVCSAPQPPGSPCTANNNCASFYCAEGPLFDVCAEPERCFSTTRP